MTFKPSLRLPAGWKHGTSLVAARESAGRIEFAPVSLTELVDSPVLAGEHFRVVPLGRDVELHMAADSPAALAISPELTESLRRLVQQADALFGARHFERYHAQRPRGPLRHRASPVERHAMPGRCSTRRASRPA